jgi:outer membrane protein OmpA-like peptidoglycan-associated protein
MKRFLFLLWLSIFLLSTNHITAQQSEPTVPLRWGAHIGANINLSGVGYGYWIPERGSASFVPFNRIDGTGVGLYAGLNAQYHILPFFGLQGRISYDGRQTMALDDLTYDTDQQGNKVYRNDELNFNTSLINLELLAKLYAGRSFHFTGGGGIGLKLNETYDYRISQRDPEVTGVMIPGSMIVGSFVGGIGYDFWLSTSRADPQWILTPFAEVAWAAGLREVDFKDQGGFDDGLSIVTIRAGVALAFGSPVYDDEQAASMGRFFNVHPPSDGMYNKRVTYDYYPMRPFVFFNRGSRDIQKKLPDGTQRYSIIARDERDALVEKSRNTFNDNEHVPDAAGQRYLQGEVYYDILNFVGFRLRENPTVTVTLEGSAPEEGDGQQLADVVKQYLVDTWEINPSRLTAKGVRNPRNPSGTGRTPTADVPMANLENRRVEIIASDNATLKNVILRAERQAYEENEILIDITTNEPLENWQAIVTGGGKRKTFGPYTGKSVYLDPSGLMDQSKRSQHFEVEVVARTKDGRTLSDQVGFDVALADKAAVAQRHIMLFDFDDQDPVVRSREFLNEVVPHIDNNAIVVVSGYTDNIGDDDSNQKLSQQRADMISGMLRDRMTKAGKKVTIRSIGYGESSDRHPYSNDLPEGRMYNRTVLIDIIK